jgi:hypothetical protein
MTGPGIVLALLIIFQVLGVIITISQVGKPRPPISGGVAVGTLIFSGLFIAAACYLAAS